MRQPPGISGFLNAFRLTESGQASPKKGAEGVATVSEILVNARHEIAGFWGS